MGELGCFRTFLGISGDKQDSGEEAALESACVCRRELGEFGGVPIGLVPL